MSVYDKYPIAVNLIPGLPKVSLDTPNHKAAGVVLHATANYAAGNDTADAERNYEAGHFNSAFVHTFTDSTRILQVAPFDNGAYHAYSFANHHFLGNELCQYADAPRFDASYDRWVWLAARQLFDLGLKPQDKVTLWSHLEISQTYQGNHEDPIAYLASHGKNWSNVVTDVTSYYNQMVAEKTAPVPSGTRHVKIVNVSANAIMMDKPDRLKSANIGLVPLNTVVELVSPVAGFNNPGIGYYKINYNGKVGYINAKFGVKV